MAGDIEEPFSINFPGDSLFSSSISFGRYENESLSWERRSSFSHNRYLEEVEKCSKPGSVHEKKAYFEAHFKKKGGLLGQISPESHNRLVYQTTENSASEKVDQGENLEIINGENHNGDFDDSSASPENHGDHEVIEFEMLNPRVSFTDPLSGASFSTASCLIDGPKDVNAEVKEDRDSLENELPIIGDEHEIETKKNIDIIASSQNLSSEAMESSPKTEQVKRTGKSSSGSQQTLFQKMTSKRETKTSKSQVDIHQNRRNISGEAFKSPEKISNKSKKEPPQIMRSEEYSSKTGTLSAHAVRKTPKIEDSRPIKGKTIHERRIGQKGRTSGESFSSSKKPESRFYPKTTSQNRTVNSTMQDTVKSASVSNFRSIEAAERRKQFHPKPENKMNIKEVDRFKSQAKTKGKADAEIKKLQKNLDIKSKPSPSSCGAVRTELDGKKAIFSGTKVGNTSTKSTAGALSLEKDTNSSASEALDTSKKMSCHTATPSPDQEILQEAISETWNVGKIDESKEKDPNVRKSRVSENCRTLKGHGVESRQKAGAPRSMNLIRRKNIKGIASASTCSRSFNSQIFPFGSPGEGTPNLT